MNPSIVRGATARTRQGSICQLCQSAATRPRLHAVQARQCSSLTPARPSGSARSSQQLTRRYLGETSYISQRLSGHRRYADSPASRIPTKPQALLDKVLEEASEIEDSATAPTEEAVLGMLNKCLKLAEIVSHGEPAPTTPVPKVERSPTSSLLGLEEEEPANPPSTGTNRISGSVKRQISDVVPLVATGTLQDPKVFITPAILERYTQIQSLLNQPEHLPGIFALYAEKPIPQVNTNPIKYSKARPKSHKNAIPANVAEMALDAAITKKDLPLVLAVIDNTYCSPAFYRAKILRKAGLPLTGLAIAPGAAYGIASAIAEMQDSMEPGLATGIATAGILTYIGCTAAIGGLAVTTANDQMNRVVWAPGMPLRQRWLREEERAALDKVADAWGFKQEWKRGEEQGEEWQNLKEFVGLRGMILDKTDLMEGME